MNPSTNDTQPLPGSDLLESADDSVRPARFVGRGLDEVVVVLRLDFPK